MANETLRFDIVGRDEASAAFSRAGDAALNMGGKMDKAALVSTALNEALKRQRAAARENATALLELAAADDSLSDAERKLAKGALEADLALRREAEAKKKSGDAAVEAAAKNRGLMASMQSLAAKAKDRGGPAWLGPALLAAPVAGSLAGAGLGAAAGAAGAFATAGVSLAAYGLVAKSVYSQAATAAQAVTKAQDAYTLAVAHGTKQATAYRAEQLAIAKAYAGMSPAQIQLSKELGGISDQWSKFRQSVTPMIAGSLQPWLRGVGAAVGNLRLLITPMAPVVHELGVQFETLMKSPYTQFFVSWLGTTGAAAARSGGKAVLDLLTGVMNVLPNFTPLMTGAGNAVSRWGDAFVRWSSSQKAADEIQHFLDWFHQEGPAVGQLLKNVGGALAALAPGIGTASAGELNAISSFFGFIAKLPPGLAKPLTETAGALLLLNKLGVVKAGVKFVGFATGGGGAAGEAATGAAATGMWGKLLPGVRLVSGALIATVVIQAVGSLVPKSAGTQVAKDQKNTPGVAIKATDFFHVTNMAEWIDRDFSHPIRAWINNTLPGIFGGAGTWLATPGSNLISGLLGGAKKKWPSLTGWIGAGAGWIGHFFSGTGNWLPGPGSNLISGLLGGAQKKWPAVTGWIGAGASWIAHFFSGTGNWLPGAGQNLISGLLGGAQRRWAAVTGWIGSAAGWISRFFSGTGNWLPGAGGNLIQGFWNGAISVWNKVASWISSLAGWIKKNKGPLSFDRTLLEPAGRAIMQGLKVGLEGGFIGVQDIISGAAGSIGNQFSGLFTIGSKIAGFFSNLFGGGGGSGVNRWAGLVHEALAMLGLPQGLAGRVLYQMQTESGGNPNAINLWDSNAAAGHPSQGLMQVIPGTFAAYHVAGTSGNIRDPLANIAAAINYARHVYGPSLGALGSGHGYAAGTSSAAPGWAWVGERGPELMRFRGGEQVIPSGWMGHGLSMMGRGIPLTAHEQHLQHLQHLHRLHAGHLQHLQRIGGTATASGAGWVGHGLAMIGYSPALTAHEQHLQHLHEQHLQHLRHLQHAGSGNAYSITVNVPPGANQAEIGRITVEAIRQYEKRSGKGWRS